MTISGRTRIEVFTRDAYACVYCGARSAETQLHVDHVVPRYEGGVDEIGNYVTACRMCNLGKGKRGINAERIGVFSPVTTRYLFWWTVAEAIRMPWLRSIELLSIAFQARWAPTELVPDADAAEFDQIATGIISMMIDGMASARGDAFREDMHVTAFAQMIGWSISMEDLSQSVRKYVAYWREVAA